MKSRYKEYCPRCDKVTEWNESKPYQRGFIDYTCVKCGFFINGYDGFDWYEPDEEEMNQLRIKYKD